MKQSYKIIKDCKIKNKEYKKGDIVTSDEIGTFYPTVMQKTEGVVQAPQSSQAGVTPAAQAAIEPDESWTNDKILAWAKERNIDLGDASKKADYLAAIKVGKVIETTIGEDGKVAKEGGIAAEAAQPDENNK